MKPIAGKRKPLSEEHKAKLRKFNLGRKLSPETRIKISNSNKGKKLKPLSEERKLAIGNQHRGKIVTEETRKKMGDAVRGEKNFFWQGGISTYERKLWLNNKRRVMKMKAGGYHSLQCWENLKEKYNWTCPCCHKKEPQIKLSRDHIIPLIKGGSDNIENIQPLCRSCNSSKHDKIIKYE